MYIVCKWSDWGKLWLERKFQLLLPSRRGGMFWQESQAKTEEYDWGVDILRQMACLSCYNTVYQVHTPIWPKQLEKCRSAMNNVLMTCLTNSYETLEFRAVRFFSQLSDYLAIFGSCRRISRFISRISRMIFQLFSAGFDTFPIEQSARLFPRLLIDRK